MKEGMFHKTREILSEFHDMKGVDGSIFDAVKELDAFDHPPGQETCSVVDAKKRMAMAFLTHPSFRRSYADNIACLIMDRIPGYKDAKVPRDLLANEVLDLIFGLPQQDEGPRSPQPEGAKRMALLIEEVMEEFNARAPSYSYGFVCDELHENADGSRTITKIHCDGEAPRMIPQRSHIDLSCLHPDCWGAARKERQLAKRPMIVGCGECPRVVREPSNMHVFDTARLRCAAETHWVDEASKLPVKQVVAAQEILDGTLGKSALTAISNWVLAMLGLDHSIELRARERGQKPVYVVLDEEGQPTNLTVWRSTIQTLLERGLITVKVELANEEKGSDPEFPDDTDAILGMRRDVKAAWRAAREADGQTEAFRILERMVDRVGYGRIDGNPRLWKMPASHEEEEVVTPERATPKLSLAIGGQRKGVET